MLPIERYPSNQPVIKTHTRNEALYKACSYLDQSHAFFLDGCSEGPSDLGTEKFN